MDNNTILVTGAYGGLGRAIVRKLLNKGYSVAAIGKDKEKLYDQFGNLQNCSYFCSDLLSDNAIEGLINEVIDKKGPLRGIVHCAGYSKVMPLYLNKWEEVEKLFSIHVFAAISLCKQIARKGNAVENCSIVLISSISAHEGASGNSAYSAAKGALEGFLPSAASEFADKNIRINVIIPGDINTSMRQKFISKISEEDIKKRENSYPFGIGEPDDIANLAAFIISDESRWITGQTLIADGGHMIRKIY